MAEIDIDGGVAATTLSGSINSGDSSINVTDGSSYPPGTTNFYIVIDRGEATEEVIEISGRSGNVLTAATRGADGTSAASHDAGATVEHCVPALALQEANTHANQTSGTPHGSAYLTPSGNAATASALQTARTIGGVSFDGSASIDLPGVNTAGNQDTSGNAATATTATTAATATSATTATTAGDLSTTWSSHSVTYTGFALGNGTETARYAQIGELVYYRGQVVLGTTSSFSGQLRIDLPVTASSSHVFAVGAAYYQDGSGSFLAGVLRLDQNDRAEFIVTPTTDDGNVDATEPFTWTNSDLFEWFLVYEAD